MIRTANPVFNNNTFSKTTTFSGIQTMTLSGTVNKTYILLICLLVSASYTWGQFFNTGSISAIQGWILGGSILGLVFALITAFKPKAAPFTAPAYAVCQGLFLGGLSAIFEQNYPGIVIQSVGLTFATLFCLLGLYRSGVIKATENFKLGVTSATGAIFLLYFASFILGFFNIQIPGIFGNGPIGILFSLGVVTIAALNLVLDFDFIEKGSESNLPKHMEWIGAFGLIVTLIWLYIEILRLLVKLREQK